MTAPRLAYLKADSFRDEVPRLISIRFRSLTGMDTEVDWPSGSSTRVSGVHDSTNPINLRTTAVDTRTRAPTAMEGTAGAASRIGERHIASKGINTTFNGVAAERTYSPSAGRDGRLRESNTTSVIEIHLVYKINLAPGGAVLTLLHYFDWNNRRSRDLFKACSLSVAQTCHSSYL